MSDKKDLSVKQAADILGISTRVLRLYIARGRFPNAYRMDPDTDHSKWLIPQKDIDDFLIKQKPGQCS